MAVKSKTIFAIALSLLLAETLFLVSVKAGWLSPSQKKSKAFIAKMSAKIGVEQAKAGDLKQLGVFWTKRDIAWAEIEPAQGAYQYKKLESILKSLSDYYNAVVTIRAISDWGTLCGESSLVDKRSCTPSSYRNYANFVTNLVKQANGRIKYWQIEPAIIGNDDYFVGTAEQYAKLLQEGYRAVKKADSSAQVVLAGIEFSDGLLTPKMADELNLIFGDYQEYFDVINLRVFGALDNIPKRLKTIKEATDKPVFLTTGGPDSRNQEFSPTLQARQVCPRIILGLENSASRVFVFQAKDRNGKNILDSTLGLKTRSDQAKPAFYALAFCAKILANNRSIEPLASAPGVHSYQITSEAGQHSWYAWSKIFGHADLSAQLGERAEIIYPSGASQIVPATKIPLGLEPIWITAPTPSIQEFTLD